MPVRHRIGSSSDLGVCVVYAEARDAAVEIVDAASAPVDHRKTPVGKRIHATAIDRTASAIPPAFGRRRERPAT